MKRRRFGQLGDTCCCTSGWSVRGAFSSVFWQFFEFVRLFLFYFNPASPLGFLTFAKILDERLGIFSPFSGEFFFDP